MIGTAFVTLLIRKIMNSIHNYYIIIYSNVNHVFFNPQSRHIILITLND